MGSNSNGSNITPTLLDADQAAAFLGVGPRTFLELRHAAWMPRAIQLGPRMLRWARSELEEAIATMPRADGMASEPHALARARIERAKRTGYLGAPT